MWTKTNKIYQLNTEMEKLSRSLIAKEKFVGWTSNCIIAYSTWNWFWF